MGRVTRLTLIAAGFRRARAQVEPNTPIPVLERLMARGDLRRVPASEPAFRAHEPWQAQVLHRLGLQPHASAPTTALGSGLNREHGSWLHAEFVHLAAGLDDLALVPLRQDQALDDLAQRELEAHLAGLTRDDGYEWLSAGAAHFLYTRATVHAETCAPDAAARMPLVEAMPRGDDARALRRLMTELQMQLHEHPVNAQRDRAGLLAANSVWLWGLGEQASSANVQLPTAFADDPFVRGLYRSHGQRCEPLPRDGAALASQAAGEVLVLLHCDALPDFDALWLAPLEQAVNAGHIQQLELILDDMILTTNRWHRWRWWRGVRPVSEMTE